MNYFIRKFTLKLEATSESESNEQGKKAGFFSSNEHSVHLGFLCRTQHENLH